MENNSLPQKKRGRPKGSKNKAKQDMLDRAQDAYSQGTGEVGGHTIPPSKKGAKGAQKIFLCPTCDEPFTYEFKPDCKHGF